MNACDYSVWFVFNPVVCVDVSAARRVNHSLQPLRRLFAGPRYARSCAAAPGCVKKAHHAHERHQDTLAGILGTLAQLVKHNQVCIGAMQLHRYRVLNLLMEVGGPYQPFDRVMPF